MTKVYGLIGYPLSHSFSKKYFTEKFEKEGIQNCVYELFPLVNANELPKLLEDNSDIQGLNVTIPHKLAVIPFLDYLDDSAQKVGAVNVIKRNENGQLGGYNSDFYGFKASLEPFIAGNIGLKALVLGKGGAAKAVVAALNDLSIPYQYVSRTASEGVLGYDELNKNIMEEYLLVINTTPLGMFPKTEEAPALSYENITDKHFVFDLVYNPAVTKLMQLAEDKNAKTKNGLEMLYLQAEKAWEIWNNK